MGFSPIDIAEAIKWRSGNFDPIELRENTIAVARWNQRQFEIPDIIGFRDYLEQSSAVGNDPLVYPGAADTPGLLLSFPYPKTADTLRWLSIAGPDELILLRAAAGYVVRRTDPLLSSRVYSNRLDQRSHCWRFRDQKKAWSDFVKFGISLLDGRQYFAMYRTDIKSYYPSVDIGSVEALLAEHQCLVPAAGIVIRLLRAWQSRDGLRGLPIGPEVSAIIGNFLLHPVDKSLERNHYSHLRWSDDILMFGQTMGSCQPSMLVLDGVLSNLGLTRSAEKTLTFNTPYDAKCNLRDQWLTSLTDLLDQDEYAGMHAVRSAYDAEIKGHSEVARYRFRWVIRTLRNKHDPYGCPSLAGNPLLMNVDPQLSCYYLAETGLKDPRVVDALMDRLSKPPEDRFDGLDLHILNAMRRRRFGVAEAKEFKKIAIDSCRRWPVRVYGWAAYIRSSGKYSELMDAAREETIPHLRRGIIANLRGHSTRSFLAHARARFPESRFTVQWLRAA